MRRWKKGIFEDKIRSLNFLWFLFLGIMLSVSPIFVVYLVSAVNMDTTRVVRLLVVLPYSIIALVGLYAPFFWQVRFMYPFSVGIPDDVMLLDELNSRLNVLFWLLLWVYVVSVMVMYFVS
jgi:H+/Cl- antiporter ClcA